MSNAAPFATAGSMTSAADPRSLVLHLEVCRLQTELERLESRLGELRDDTSTAGPGHAGSTGTGSYRTDELVDRLVATLLESGRVEIAESAARRCRDAEAGLDADRARARSIVDAAQAELERALAERGRALAAAWDQGLDVVVLAEAEQDLLHGGPGAPAVETVRVERVLLEPDARPTVPALVDRPAAAPVSSAPALHRAAEVEEARTDAAFDVWMAVAPGADPAPEPVDVAGVIEPLPVPEPESVAEPEPAPSIDHSRTRSGWLLPLEVAAALLVAALLVVLVLVLIG